MSNEEIESIKRYCSAAFTQQRNGLGPYLVGTTLLDFTNDIILLCLENPSKSLPFIINLYKFNLYITPDKAPYIISNMTFFSELVERTGDVEIVEKICGASEDIYTENNVSLAVDEIAKFLYPRKKNRLLFIDFLYGQGNVNGQKKRDFRERIFNNRDYVLSVLLKHSIITQEEYDMFSIMSANLKGQKRPKVQQILRNTSSAIANRKYYETHKEYFKNRAKERSKKLKAVEQ